MKVLSISDVWWPVSLTKPGGGVEKFAVDIFNMLNKRKDKFDCYLLGPSDSDVQDENFISWDAVSKDSMVKSGDYGRYNYHKVAEKIKSIKDADLIINNINNITVLKALCETGIPIIHVTHLVMKYFGVDEFYKRVLHLKQTYKNFHILAVSNYVKFNIEKSHGLGIFDGILSPNYQESPSEVNNNPDDYYVLVGRVCLDKNSGYICKVFENRTEKLLVIGAEVSITNKEKEWFTENIHPVLESSKNIKWLGSLDHSEVINYIRNAKALVHGCTDEAYPLVVLEAQKCGVPVILAQSRIPNGSSEFVIEGVTGFNANIYKKREAESYKIFRDLLQEVPKLDRNYIYSKFKEEFSEENFMEKLVGYIEEYV